MDYGIRVKFYDDGATRLDQRINKIIGSSDKAADSTERFTDATKKVSPSNFAAVDKQLIKLAATLGTVVAGALSLNQAFSLGLGFDAAAAELSTLLAGTDIELQTLTDSAREFAVEFGTSASNQVQSFYQAVSAGATTAADAIDILDESNKLAIGGVTETSTAVDVLTTAVNAFRDSGLTAAQASDSLFTAVRLGKTTVDELAASVGRVIPVASAVGIEFDEITASIAALTSVGQSTPQAVDGLSAAFSQLLNPSQQARQLAAELGIEFNAAAVEAQGLAGFLDGLTRATGGSQEALARLFGSEQALRAVLALTGNAAAALSANLDEMASKAGAANAAFELVSSSGSQQFQRALSALQEIGLTVGLTILDILAPALQFFADNVDIIIKLLPALGAGMLVVFGPAILASVSTLTTAVLNLNVAIARNPLGFLATVAVAAITAIFTFRQEIYEFIRANEFLSGVLDNLIGLFEDIVRGASTIIGVFLELIGVIDDASAAVIELTDVTGAFTDTATSELPEVAASYDAVTTAALSASSALTEAASSSANINRSELTPSIVGAAQAVVDFGRASAEAGQLASSAADNASDSFRSLADYATEAADAISRAGSAASRLTGRYSADGPGTLGSGLRFSFPGREGFDQVGFDTSYNSYGSLRIEPLFRRLPEELEAGAIEITDILSGELDDVFKQANEYFKGDSNLSRRINPLNESQFRSEAGEGIEQANRDRLQAAIDEYNSFFNGQAGEIADFTQEIAALVGQGALTNDYQRRAKNLFGILQKAQTQDVSKQLENFLLANQDLVDLADEINGDLIRYLGIRTESARSFFDDALDTQIDINRRAYGDDALGGGLDNDAINSILGYDAQAAGAIQGASSSADRYVAANAGFRDVNVVMSVSASDADSFARSQDQIYADLGRKIRRATSRAQ